MRHRILEPQKALIPRIYLLNWSLAIGSSLLTTAANAQSITIDGSTPTVLSSGNTTCTNDCTITGGSSGSVNVFHSFSDFNVSSGSTVTFDHPSVENIFSRVTGSTPSNIDGTLRVNGSANLFLLNTNGILFGNQAALDLQGSFLATTAESIRFENNLAFDNSSAPVNSLLTVSTPIGLQFGAGAGSISITGNGHRMRYSSRGIFRNFPSAPDSGLRVESGENLALIGADVNLQGANLLSDGGHIEVGAVSGGRVDFDSHNAQWQFDYSQASNLGNLSLAQSSAVDVSASDAGSIHLNGAQISVQDGSTLLAQVTGSGNGEIEIDASESLTLVGTNLAFPNSLMQTSAYVEVAPGAVGDGNSLLRVNAPQIDLSAGAQIGLTMAGSGQAGNVRIQSDTINSDGVSNVTPSSLFTTVAPRPDTPDDALGGNLFINTDQLNITNGSQIAANTFGPGNGGQLAVNAEEIVVSGFSSNGPSLLSTSSQTAPNDSLGPPTAPPILIPSGEGSGSSGSATIDTQRLIATNGGQILTGTNSNNPAGNLTINASEFVALSDRTTDGRSGIFSGARAGSGAGGDIIVNTPRLSVTDSATINASNFPSLASSTRTPGTGPAGNITLNAQSISLDNDAVITADTVAGDRANISMQSESIVLRNASRITTNATGPASGGNINIDTTALIALENSDITANAEENTGGRIVVNAQTIIGTEYREELTSESDITATSALGPAFSGSVELNTPDGSPSDGLSGLPENTTNTEQIVAACEQLEGNTFIATGRGGLPSENSQFSIEDSVWNDFRFVKNERNTVHNKSSADIEAHIVSVDTGTSTLEEVSSITEAQTWTIDHDGQVSLHTYANTLVALSPSAGCLAQP